MGNNIGVESGNFLNEEQKNIKQQIMMKLVGSLFGGLQENCDKFDEQTSMDLLVSCLVMFCREVTIHLAENSNAESKEDFINRLIELIRREALAKLNAESKN